MLDEIDTVLAGKSPGYEDLDRLPWTKACIFEAMRIHPPVYLSMRSAMADDDLNGYFIKHATIVVIVTHQLHRNPDVWTRSAAVRSGPGSCPAPAPVDPSPPTCPSAAVGGSASVRSSPSWRRP